MTDDRIILTRAGYDKLQEELTQLEGEESDEVAALLVEAHEDEEGEEATFYEAQMAKERLADRIAYVKMVLSRAEIIDEDPDPDSVSPGNRVTVYDFEEKEETVFDLLAGAEIATARRRGVSVDSPVGKALLGHKIGEVVEVEVPAGVMRYEIRKIEMIPDGD